MEFCWITLRVTEMETSLKFYRDILNLEIAARFQAGPGREIVMLGAEDKPKVELICQGDGVKPIPSAHVSIGFLVNSLDQTMADFQAKAIPITKGPFSPSPGTKFFFVEDPDGYEIQIVEK